MKNKFILFILFRCLISNSTFAQVNWPTEAWPIAAPAEVALNSDSLTFLERELGSGKYGYVDGILIIRHGKIAYLHSFTHDYVNLYKVEAREKGPLNPTDPSGPYNYFNSWWHPFFHESNLHTLQSVSKTITSIVIGVAISNKDFPNLNTSILQFFDTSVVKNIDDRKRHITILHLLTMTGGFDWNEQLPYADPKNTGSAMEASDDWVKYAIDRPMSDEPGKVFNYNGGETEILAYIFRVTTGMDLEEYAVKHLFSPLGIKNYYWKRSPSGLIDSEGGLYLEKTDLAKLFYLYLHGGNWGDKQLIDPWYVSASIKPYVVISANVSYGYKWWLRKYGNSDMEVAWTGSGFGGQVPMIIPEYDVVAMFTGWNVLPERPHYTPSFLLEKVLHSLDEYNLKSK
jgi:CubicO group peptidase (beta-lactamase class C family)